MIRRGLIGATAVALVVLVARSLAYAAEPSPSARFLEHKAEGPALPVFALTVLALGAAVAIVLCWLAAVAVGERALIERRRVEPFAVVRTFAVAGALTLCTCLAGGLLEAYIHWRAGLGWHGLHCLIGPVHRDLLPIEAGLSLFAAAVMAAARHVGAWMRRTFARLAAQLPPLAFVEWLPCTDVAALSVALLIGVPSARAPPALG